MGYYDDEDTVDGDGGSQVSPNGNSLGYPWSRPNDWADSVVSDDKKAWLRGEIISQYQQYYGREPSESEINGAINAYQHYGGDYMRSWISGEYELAKDRKSQDGGVMGRGAGGFGAFQPPSFDMPSWAPPAPFQYDAFVAPDEAAVLSDPGYAFRAREGQRGLRNSASAAGLARTGGFEKEMASWLQGLASQEYGNVYNRRWNEHQGGYNMAAQNYERDWRKNLTDYTLAYQREADEYARALSTYGVNLDAHNSNFGNSLSLYNLATRNLPTYTPIQLPNYGIPIGG